ncbi:restriction endonuclease [Oceanimonas sp. CAM02]|uniref:restriction endonuclease n=1 Tax=Oceanimonas sp. CAM02 TaxID=3080336 RepID=UPI002935E677|nr:restriction endonuclease [Oceanimonas sp. CAM02]MDV2858276.1 restriction endonuclease [Oceanimonas sp. CAM02]
MARRRRQSPIEDMIDIAAMLPWWLSLLLALISYLILDHFSDQPFTVEMSPGSGVPTNLTELMLRPFLIAMQFFIPVAFTLGAGLSAIKALKGRRLAHRYVATSAKPSISPLPASPANDMSWKEFELLVGQAFRQQGYRVIDGGENGPDGGVDVQLRKDGQRFFVQCKHWKARSVGVSVVRELYGVIAGAGADGGFVVTSGDFTEEAKIFASDKRLSLIDGKALDNMLMQAKMTLAEEGLKRQRPSSTNSSPPALASAPASAQCPRCTAPMVKRKARQGANAGQSFWGCSRFPQCRGTRSL